MKNRKTALFLDSILTFIIAFFAFLIMLSTLKISIAFKFILCLLFALCLSGMVFIHKRRKYNSLMLSEKEVKRLNDILFGLELNSDAQNLNFIFSLLKACKIDAKIVEGKLVYKNTLYLFNFSKQLSRGEFCNAIRGINQNIIFFCNTLSSEAEEVALLLKEKVKIINGEGLFSLMKKVDFNEESQEKSSQIKKIKIKELLSRALTKKRALKYAVASATLLLFSKFTFYPVYYRITSAILILLSAICLFFGKKEIALEQPILVLNEE